MIPTFARGTKMKITLMQLGVSHTFAEVASQDPVGGLKAIEEFSVHKLAGRRTFQNNQAIGVTTIRGRGQSTKQPCAGRCALGTGNRT